MPTHNLMATIYNTDLFKEIKDGAKIQQLTDAIPTQLQGTVVPVMEVNPKLLRRTNFIKSVNRTTSGNATLFTTSSDVDTFITAVQLAFIQDATCDGAIGTPARLSVVIGGVSTVIIDLPALTLTACADATAVTFPHPLKIDRGSTMTLGGSTYTAGLKVRVATVYGFTVENTNA